MRAGRNSSKLYVHENNPYIDSKVNLCKAGFMATAYSGGPMECGIKVNSVADEFGVLD